MKSFANQNTIALGKGTKPVRAGNIIWAAAAVTAALLSYAVLVADIRISLWPHTQFFKLMYGMSFDFIPGTGYVEQSGLFAITGGCMGAKLFTSAFLLIAIAFGGRYTRFGDRLKFTAAAYFLSLLGAFGVTLARISISLPFCGLQNAQLIHNGISLMFYFGSMAALYCIMQSRQKRGSGEN
jgi:exosortase K